MVYQFGIRLEIINIRIFMNVGIFKFRIFFILDSRITLMIEQLTIPCSIPPARHLVDSIYPCFEDNKYKI